MSLRSAIFFADDFLAKPAGLRQFPPRMTPQGPHIYISADATELGFLRDAVEATLHKLGATPIVSHRTVEPGKTLSETIRERLQDCCAVIHIAGQCAGPEEPRTRERQTFEDGRRSFTQFEYDLAVELRKELYVFVCPEDLVRAPADPATVTVPEPPELRRLQHAHLTRLMDGTRPYREIHSTAELLKILRPLGRSIRNRSRPIRRRIKPGLLLLLGLVILISAASAVWWQVPRPQPVKIHPHRPGVPPSQDPK